MKQSRLALLVLLAVLVCLWLLYGAGERETPRLESDDPVDEAHDPTLHGAEGVGPDAAGGVAVPALRGDTTRAKEGAGRGPVRVRIVGLGGHPIPHALVYPQKVGVPSEGGPNYAADENGIVVTRDLPYDGSYELQVLVGDPDRKPGTYLSGTLLPAASQAERPRVRGPEITYRARAGRLVRVHVLEADTGAVRKDALVRWTGDRLHPGEAQRASPARFLVAQHPTIGSPEPFGAYYQVEAPRGFVAWDERAFAAAPCLYARELKVVVPLRQSLRATIVATREDGSPAVPKLGHVTVAGLRRPVEGKVDGLGNLQLDGIPFYRDEPYEFWVWDESAREEGRVHGLLPHRFAHLPTLRATLMEVEVVEEDIADHLEIDNDLPYEEIFGDSEGKPAPPVRTLRVRVLRRDGSPAVGARVQILVKLKEPKPDAHRWLPTAWTDATGHATLREPAAGTFDVRADQPGLLECGGTVAIATQGRSDLVLREPEGGRIALEVVDEEGAALPFAACQFNTPSQHPYVDLQDGVQRMDRFTDHRGRRTYPHVHPGTVTLWAWFGTRRKKVELEVREGQTTPVRVVLPKRK